MENLKYRALVVDEIAEKKFHISIQDKRIEDLPEGDVIIKVKYSALNYKDALSANGHKGISRTFPHTPGIDAAGIVADTKSSEFQIGDEVFVTGYDLGMNTSGGFQEYIRVPAGWVVRKPESMSLRETMIYGTAGFTAGVSIFELQKHSINPDSKVLVTGATGGVGSLAVGMLAKLGYQVTASTGKQSQHEFLKKLGASEILPREELQVDSPRPLLKGRWQGAIDTVGGKTLSTVFKSINHRGTICVLGLVESDRFDVTVYPFLLRGVTIVGIDSAERPMDYRLNIWKLISEEWRLDSPEFLVKEVSLEQLPAEIDLILKGGQCGKVLVNMEL